MEGRATVKVGKILQEYHRREMAEVHIGIFKGGLKAWLLAERIYVLLQCGTESEHGRESWVPKGDRREMVLWFRASPSFKSRGVTTALSRL